ncbi:uncharacterized protein G2W53_020998 [Senna tora]|uniref:Uncharacterized protein n=1 Tax=Senna tora TaxID=362788 RepID=A0A834TS44_9FABA|nr:uncharacterized protein G2W53_020998 [Senna tora]
MFFHDYFSCLPVYQHQKVDFQRNPQQLESAVPGRMPFSVMKQDAKIQELEGQKVLLLEQVMGSDQEMVLDWVATFVTAMATIIWLLSNQPKITIGQLMSEDEGGFWAGPSETGIAR